MNHFLEDFTERNYKRLINLAKQEYNFEDFTEADKSLRVVLWRHDVDFSVHRALQLAQIESEELVKATYFIQLNSEFYNVFENGIKKRINGILALGHMIGLHFDPMNYKITNKSDLEYFLTFEKQILENLFGITINVFSFHNPTTDILKFDDYKLANMINTYAKNFKEEFGYCSDSNGYWRFERLEDVLRKATYNKLQILTHPVWWQKEVMRPRQRVQRCISGRSKFTSDNYNDLLEQNGRKNIGISNDK